MCDCIKRIKQRIAVKLPETKDYEGMVITDVKCPGEALMCGEKEMYEGLGVPFIVYHKPIGRRKKTEVNMEAKYCPFCGEQYNLQADQ